jgi:hypothetical protein
MRVPQGIGTPADEARQRIDDIRVLAPEQPADVGATEHDARLRTARAFHEPAQLRGAGRRSLDRAHDQGRQFRAQLARRCQDLDAVTFVDAGRLCCVGCEQHRRTMARGAHSGQRGSDHVDERHAASLCQACGHGLK